MTYSERLFQPLAIVFVAGFLLSTPTSALTYQESLNVEFNFNPAVTISLSSTDLVISNLVPGSYADSNTITIAASTNNATGYTLMASVGNNTHSNPSYNNTSLNHSNGANAFTSVAANADLANITTNNTWGYANSLDDGATWSNFSGLPIYSTTPKTLLETNTNGGSELKFKIRAKASNSQPSGEYTNVINFIAVANEVIEDPIRTNYFSLSENTSYQIDSYSGLIDDLDLMLSEYSNGEWDIDNFELTDLKEALTSVYNPDVAYTLADFVNALSGYLSANYEIENNVLYDDAGNEYNLNDYVFMSDFIGLGYLNELSDQFELSIDGEYNTGMANINFASDELKGTPTTYDWLKIMYINPDYGDLQIINIDPESYDQERGSFTVEINATGIFCFIGNAYEP